MARLLLAARKRMRRFIGRFLCASRAPYRDQAAALASLVESIMVAVPETVPHLSPHLADLWLILRLEAEHRASRADVLRTIREAQQTLRALYAEIGIAVDIVLRGDAVYGSLVFARTEKSA